jgi:hypothetical protein
MPFIFIRVLLCPCRRLFGRTTALRRCWEMADAAAAAPAAGGDKKTPSEFLKNVLGRPVVVKLNSGVDYRGASTSAAGHLPASLSLLAAPPRALLLRSGVRAPTLCRCPSRRRERAR